MKLLKTFCLFLFCASIAFAQQPTQTIRGVVRDKQTKQSIPSASIVVLNTKPTIGTISDSNGFFEIKKVPVGRVNIQVQFVGYQPFTIEDFLLLSTKETFLEVELNEGSITTNEVVISASRNAFAPVNELSVVSTRSFTVDETERVAAGVNDPGRVALSYPGVRVGQDDTENQIVVRGNSPIGILWRLEGIDIPNPNHFAVVGSSGGGLTVFSAQLLARSDFSTGGMAAEYGNAISGAFDMHFRQGNLEKREYRAKIGILGLDFATEGPISKGNSSYLINYRYSTLGLLNKLGFNLVGERISNDFQDLSFNLTFKSKNQKSITTVFGIGGLSLEHYFPVDDPTKRDPKVFNNREEQYKPSNVGSTGVTWTYLPDKKSYIKAVVALMASNQTRNNDTLNLTNDRFRYSTEKYLDTRLATSLTYNRKLSDKVDFKTGIIFNQIFFDFYKNTLQLSSTSDVTNQNLRVLVSGKGNTQSFQQYAQAHIELSQKLSLNVGYHFLSLAANGSKSIEPRISMQYQLASNQKLSLSYGVHSRILPMMAYYLKDSTGNLPNKNLKLLKSQHAILAYHLYTQNKMRISVETYLQKLYNVPVVPSLTDNYWMLNNSNGFPTFKVVSEGKGLNYGVDVAAEKLFSNSYFILLTGSLFKSTFQPFNQKTYFSRYSSNFSTAYTFGKEFSIKKGRIIQIGGRFMFNGGFRYTPYDPMLSKEKGYYVPLKDADFKGQVPAYQRLDARIAYRFNAKKVAGNISLDIQNVLNRLNPTSVAYDKETNSTYILYRGSGLIPLLAMQFDF